GVPTLGLCFGHQLLAHLFGGEVGFVSPDQRKLEGLRRVRVDKSGPFPYDEGELVVSHRETVTRVPPGFAIFASSQEIPTDGLAHTALPIWTFQSHPEATSDFLRNQ